MIGLIACSKSKLDRAAPARELYTSPLFRMSLAYAESRCSTVYIASALYDLLELDRVIAPYDRTVASLTLAQRKLFGAAIARGLWDRHGSGLRTSFDVLQLLALAGAAYIEPIALAFARMGAPVDFVEPLRGMQIGERLSWLTAQTAKPAELPVSTSTIGAQP